MVRAMTDRNAFLKETDALREMRVLEAVEAHGRLDASDADQHIANAIYVERVRLKEDPRRERRRCAGVGVQID